MGKVLVGSAAGGRRELLAHDPEKLKAFSGRLMRGAGAGAPASPTAQRQFQPVERQEPHLPGKSPINQAIANKVREIPDM